MAIRFDGIEFDSVKELMEYKNTQTGVIVVEEKIDVIIPKVNKNNYLKVQVPKKRKNKRYTKKELSLIKALYDEAKSEGRQRVDGDKLRALAELIGRNQSSISATAYDYGFTPSPRVEEPKYMIRKDPVLPETKEGNRIDVLKKTKITPELSNEDTIFPVIHPLDEKGNEVFEQMLINLVANKGRIRYFDCQSIPLPKGVEWEGRLWRDFTMQVMQNHSKICKALNCDKSKLRVEMELGKYHVIVYD
jgi:hypothetical protein